jgi:hypothetical protein
MLAMALLHNSNGAFFERQAITMIYWLMTCKYLLVDLPLSNMVQVSVSHISKIKYLKIIRIWKLKKTIYI